jgi:hypothetical protein
VKKNGRENLVPGGNERHGAYLLLNRGVVRENNRDIASAMESLQAHLVDYVGGQPSPVQALLIDAIIPSFGFRKLIERHCWRSGALVEDRKQTRVAPPLREAYWAATNSMVRSAKALAETVTRDGRGESTLDLKSYLRQREKEV